MDTDSIVDEGLPAPEDISSENVQPPAADLPVVSESHTETSVLQTTAQTVELDKNGDKIYPSLFDTIPTSFVAIAVGIFIIGGIQWIVRKIFEKEKKEHKALTQFVTSMFAFIVGIWIADKLIAGPSAQLLWENESRDVLTFIKDITLMVFAYYFGTKANVPQDGDSSGGADG